LNDSGCRRIPANSSYNVSAIDFCCAEVNTLRNEVGQVLDVLIRINCTPPLHPTLMQAHVQFLRVLRLTVAARSVSHLVQSLDDAVLSWLRPAVRSSASSPPVQRELSMSMRCRRFSAPAQ
jgi:hypothetical protein